MLMYNIKSLTLLIIIILCIHKYLSLKFNFKAEKITEYKNDNL